MVFNNIFLNISLKDGSHIFQCTYLHLNTYAYTSVCEGDIFGQQFPLDIIPGIEHIKMKFM